MLPLFPFIGGLIAGAAAISLYRNQKTQERVKEARKKLKKESARAQEALRHATVSGLSALESSSARLRDRLQAAPETTEAEAPRTPGAEKKSGSGRKRRTQGRP